MSVQWGPWHEAGMATETGATARLKAKGLGSIGNEASCLHQATVSETMHVTLFGGSTCMTKVGMAALQACLCAPNSVLAACPFRWQQYLKQPLGTAAARRKHEHNFNRSTG